MANTGIRLIIFFAAKDGEVLNSQQKQDMELTVPQIMNTLVPDYHPSLPVGMEQKTQFKDYTVEVRNRFKRLDLIYRVPDELCTDVHDTVQET